MPRQKIVATIFPNTDNEGEIEIRPTSDDHVYVQFPADKRRWERITLGRSEYSFSGHLYMKDDGSFGFKGSRPEYGSQLAIYKVGDYSAFPKIAPTHRKKIENEVVRVVNEVLEDNEDMLIQAERERLEGIIARLDGEMAELQEKINEIQRERREVIQELEGLS